MKAALFGIGLAASAMAAAMAPEGHAGAAGSVAQPTAAGLAAARTNMTGWRPVDAARLDTLRGGFETGGLQVSFGISRAVYINGDLVVSTSLTIPDVSRITSEQAARLASALQTAAAAGPNAAATANAAIHAALGGQASQHGAPGHSGDAAGGGAPPSGPAGAGTTAPAALPAAVVATATGTVATNGLLNLVQNGPGNSFNAGSLAGTPATVIQNTLNNQAIQSVLTIDAGVNTLQAFRTAIAGAALDSALQRAASLR